MMAWPCDWSLRRGATLAMALARRQNHGQAVPDTQTRWRQYSSKVAARRPSRGAPFRRGKASQAIRDRGAPISPARRENRQANEMAQDTINVDADVQLLHHLVCPLRPEPTCTELSKAETRYEKLRPTALPSGPLAHRHRMDARRQPRFTGEAHLTLVVTPFCHLQHLTHLRKRAREH